jgi:hypothetical protein
VVLNGDLLIVEDIIQIEQIMESHEVYWVDQAFLIQEALHFVVFNVLDSHVIKLHLIEVPLGVVESIHILFNVDLWQVVHQEKARELEWLVVRDWQHVILE